MLPAQGDTAPLSITFGAPQTSSGISLTVPKTNGPLVGYSLREISESQQVKRTFAFNRTQAVTRNCNPNGALSHDLMGAAFDPAKQITRVALGQGPFKILVIQANAGFDFATHSIVTATVFITYGQNPNGEPRESLTIRLDKDHTSGQVQFFADDEGTQSFNYQVEFVYDADKIVGSANRTVKSPLFKDVTQRSITVDLARHSPVIPVEVVAGQLQFNDNTVKQVQARVAASPNDEGHTVLLSVANTREIVNVFPTNPAQPNYYVREEFFFQDTSTVVEKAGLIDKEVIVNEPSDQILRISPQISDPNGLVTEILFDAEYTHKDGVVEKATLHLKPGGPKSNFDIHLRAGDVKEWDGTARFVMQSGEPMMGPTQHYLLDEPFVGLSQSRFRVATAMLLEDPSIFTNNDLLAIQVTFGLDLTNPSSPSSSVLLRSNRTQASMVLPGVSQTDPLQVSVQFMRHGQVPTTRTTSLAANQSTIYITL